MLKLKNGDDDSIVLDSSSLENVVAGNGAGAMDGNSPGVGTFDNDDDNDVCRLNLEGPSFWVQTLEWNILTPSLSDPLDMSATQRNFVSHYCSGGGMVALSSSSSLSS